MARIITDNLTPMQVGRLDKALDALVRIDGAVTTMRAHIAGLTGEKRETDGMAEWNRRRSNAMNGDQQRAYEARLRAKRVYLLAEADPRFGTVWRHVPKVIYDAVAPDQDQDQDQGEAEALAAWTPADSVALFGSV